MKAKHKTPIQPADVSPENIWSKIAMFLFASVLAARFLTTENIYGWTGPLSAWAYAEPGPGPVTTLCFAGLLLLGFCIWLAGVVRAERMIRWPIWLVISVLVMAGCVIAAAGLAGQKRIATHLAADWVVQWLAFLMLLDLLRSQALRRLLLSAILATAALVAVKCIYQVYAEFPDILAGYWENPAEYLNAIGVSPGTARAAQLEERITQAQATGYFAVGNVTASVLILSALTAIGLAADRVFTVGRKFSLTFGLMLLGLAGLMIYAIILTGSRGAMVGLAVGLFLFFGYLLVKRVCAARLPGLRLVRYYRTLVLATLILIAVLSLTVVGCGLKYGSLGAKTLTYRWHYWVGSAGVFAEHPWFGVGPGNFRYHYLAHKLPEAVEEVANPHNPIIQMFTEAGLLGGGALLCCLAGIFVLATRDGKAAGGAGRNQPAGRLVLRPLVWMVLLAGGAFALRTAFNAEGVALARIISFQEKSEDLHLLVLGLIAPAAVWVIAFLIAACDSDDLTGENLPATPLLRIAVICGLAGFVLHNQITFAMLHSGAGLVFWSLAAMAIAMRSAYDAEDYRLSRGDKYIVVAGATAGLLMFVWSILLPAVRETRHLTIAGEAYRLGAPAREVDKQLRQAAQALPSDPWPHTFAARILAEQGLLDQAIQRQRQAVDLSPADWTARAYLADLLTERARRSSESGDWDAANMAFRNALECYPTSPGLCESAADAYAEQQNWAAAVEYYEKALHFDQAKKLDPNHQWPADHRGQVQAKLSAARDELLP